MPAIRNAESETPARFQKPISRLYEAQMLPISNKSIIVGGLPEIAITASRGVDFFFREPRSDSVFALLAPPLPTAFTSPELRKMYQRHFDITLDTDEATGVATLRPRVGSALRLFTAHTLFPDQHAMQEVPRPIAVAFGGILSLPSNQLRPAGKNGLVVVDDLGENREVAVAIPLLRLVTRGLVPQALNDWWRELFRREKTLVVLDSDNLMSSNKRKKLMPILRSMKPIGVVTR